ncbi:MAG: cupredoxin domain-containing protein [archaeon]
MNKLAIAIALAAVLVLSGCVQGNQQAPAQVNNQQAGNGTPAAKAIEVQVKDFAFSPAELAIEKGTTVKWTNSDSTAHTITSAGNFDSGTIPQGRCLKSNEPLKTLSRSLSAADEELTIIQI